MNGSIASVKELSTRNNPVKNSGFEIKENDSSSKQEAKSGNGASPNKVGDLTL